MLWETNVLVVRQVRLEIAVCLISFTLGMVLAFPSLLNTAALSPDADIKLTSDQVSWMATCFGFGGLVGYAFIPAVFEIFGRKLTNVVTNLFIFIGSLILYVACDVYSLAFGRITQGLAIGGTFISAISLCECISPKRRGCSMVLNKIFLSLGSLTCHYLGFVLHWRQIALFGALWNFISIVFCLTCAESPAFLAIRGQFDECVENFLWYRGDTLNARIELKELVSAQMETFKLEENNNRSISKKAYDMLRTKEFQKSILIITLAMLCLDAYGRYYSLSCSTQALITNNTTLTLYVSIIMDSIVIFALSVSAVLVKHFNRRTLLFKSGFCSVFLMFIVSFSIILGSKFQILQDMEWLIPVLLLLNTFITNIGLVPIAFVLSGEVFSLPQKGLASFISGIMFLISSNVIWKLTPLIIDKTGVEGTFSFYGFILFIFLVVLRQITPETKDKTLQEIEDEMKGIVRKTSETELFNHSKVVLLKLKTAA